MKNCVTFPSSLKNIAYLSFFAVRNIIEDEGLFRVFPYQNLISYFSIRLKEVHQQFITCHRQTELSFVIVGGGGYIFQKIVTFEDALFPSFLWNMWYLSRRLNSFLNFYFGLTIKNVTVYISTPLVTSIFFT